MAFSTGTSAQQSEINVTPLIDVLLVLLIIFMVIVPVMPLGLASEVPQQSKAPQQTTVGPVSLRLLGDGTGQNLRYEVDGQGVDSSRLNEALLARLSMRSSRSVYVTSSPDVSYKAVAEAVGAAKAAGASTVGLGRLAPAL